MQSVRRITSAALLWLGIGLALTILISWAIAAWMPLRATATEFYSEHSRYTSIQILNTRIYRGPGWIRRSWDLDIVWADGVHPFIYCTQSDQPLENPEWIGTKPISWLAWGRLEHIRPDPQNLAWDGCEHAAGWPLPALWYGMEVDTATGKFGIRVMGGIPLPPLNTGLIAAKTRALPFRPIWIGLAIDSLAWGLIAFGGASGLRSLHAARRRRRGLCPRCSYDLLRSFDSGCPECGWNR